MPRNIIKRLILRSKQGEYRSSWPWLNKLLNQSNLFHVNKHSISAAVFAGFFCALLPLPGQVIFAALLAVGLRANLPISIICTFITNPLTIVPIYTGSYLAGLHILGMTNPFPEDQMSIEYLLNNLDHVWKPMFAGALLIGFSVASAGYLASRIAWRIVVLRVWRKRQQLRADQANNRTNDV